MTKVLALASFFAASIPSQALACAVCFGDPQSSQTQSALAGVLVMLGVTLFILITVGSVAS